MHSNSSSIGGKIQIPQTQNEQPGAFYQEHFIQSSYDLYSHAPSLTQMQNGQLIASWYAGTREGAKDVKIYTAKFDAGNSKWLDRKAVMSSSELSKRLNRHIRKLGNPVISQAPDGKLWLFFVSVSVGGWAGSSINSMYSMDNGESWTQPERLVTSPFLNVSTLVKQPPLYLHNGQIILPVYHEFIAKFSEALVLSADGELLKKSRITWGMNSLQPSLAALDETHILAMSRNAIHGESIYSNTGNSESMTWVTNPDSGLPNPNSAVSVIRTSAGELLLASNDMPLTRNRLSLHRSDNGLQWQKAYELEYLPYTLQHATPDTKRSTRETLGNEIKAQFEKHNMQLDETVFSEIMDKMCRKSEVCESHYAYPYLLQTSNGNIHLLYTWQKSIIKHVIFNQAWLDKQTEGDS